MIVTEFQLWGAVEDDGKVAFATVGRSDIRGSEPHNRDPSGAVSDYARVRSEGHRRRSRRILLSVRPSAATSLLPRLSLCQVLHCAPASVRASWILLVLQWPR